MKILKKLSVKLLATKAYKFTYFKGIFLQYLCKQTTFRTVLSKKYLRITEKALSLHSTNNGALAERLGTGLQNLLQRFDSARHLFKTPWISFRGVSFIILPYFLQIVILDQVQKYVFRSLGINPAIQNRAARCAMDFILIIIAGPTPL